jgi:hypothetical protein
VTSVLNVCSESRVRPLARMSRRPYGWPTVLLQHSLLSVFKDQEARERRIHVSVQVRRPAQQQQPDLITSFETQYRYIRSGSPVRDALRPNGRYHLAVLDYHHSRLRHIRTLNAMSIYTL